LEEQNATTSDEIACQKQRYWNQSSSIKKPFLMIFKNYLNNFSIKLEKLRRFEKFYRKGQNAL
jgi:hypothetical protein